MRGGDGRARNRGVPRWAQVRTPQELAAFADAVGWPVVLKTPRGGYDGKGVLLAEALADGQDWFDLVRRDEAELARREAAGGAFARPGFADGLLAEEKVPFTRELAVLVARSPSGQAAAWPVVETVQTDGICTEVLAPAPGLDGRPRSPDHRGGAADRRRARGHRGAGGRAVRGADGPWWL